MKPQSKNVQEVPDASKEATVLAAQAVKSYCKVANHSHHEIVFACYECSDTFCYSCLPAHQTHTLIYFKDSYLVSNYDNVQSVVVQNVSEANSLDLLPNARAQKQPSQRKPKDDALVMPTIEMYRAKNKFTQENVFVKKFKDFKSRPVSFKDCVLL